MTSMNVEMSGFFGSEFPNVSGDGTSSSSSSEEVDSPSETEVASKKEPPKPATKMISALEAFEEIEGPPSFLDLDAYERKSQSEKKRKSTGDYNPSKEEEREAEKKKQRSIVIRAEPVKYTSPQTSEALALSTSKESKTTGSKPMDVSEFLIKGGGPMLPRKTKVQRDKEKSKREKGQSSHSQWKSEDEMLLRQQYD